MPLRKLLLEQMHLISMLRAPPSATRSADGEEGDLPAASCDRAAIDVLRKTRGL